MHMLGLFLMLAAMMGAAWYYGQWTDTRKPVPMAGQRIRIADGDSFYVGARKIRLDGIDAPEYHQLCKDAHGTDWPCGKVARASLERLVLMPGLACVAGTSDQYHRAIATCSTPSMTDLSAEQVRAGMAISHEYMGMRSYGVEEDEARDARRGIWQGTFAPPSEWRQSQPAS